MGHTNLCLYNIHIISIIILTMPIYQLRIYNREKDIKLFTHTNVYINTYFYHGN